MNNGYKFIAMKDHEWVPVTVLAWHSNGTATVIFENGEIYLRNNKALKGVPVQDDERGVWGVR